MIPDYPVSRVETYLAAILGQDAALPTPQTRSDLFWANLAGGTWALPAPQSREEILLAYILGDDSLTLPTPQSRVELFLAKVAGMDVELPEPASREELYLAEWVDRGGGLYRTVSGNPVLFTAKQAAALKSLMIDVQPVQSGSGDPSPENVRPISGMSEIRLEKSGLNMTNPAYSYYISSTKYLQPFGFHTATSQYKKSNGIWLVAGQKYRIHFEVPADQARVMGLYGARYGLSSQITLINSGSTRYVLDTVYTPSVSDYYGFWVYTNNNWTGVDTANSFFQIQVGDGPFDHFEAFSYSRQTFTIPTPPGTVYGGTLDVLTGVLTVTMGQIASYAGETIGEPWLSSEDVYVPGTTPTAGAQVVYTLAEPQTYQLTAQEVSALIGGNTLWTDAAGLTVEYRWN